LFERTKCAIAEVTLIIPSVLLLGQNAGQSFAIEVHPVVMGAINAIG